MKDDSKRDRRIGLAALGASIAPGVALKLTAKQRGNALKERLLAMDGDAAIRAANPDYDTQAWDALGKLSGNPDVPVFKLPAKAPANSYAMAPNRQMPKGAVISGIPSRTVLAHEFGHINRFKDPKVVRRLQLLGIGSALAPFSYFVGTKGLGLSDEQSLAGSAALTAGIGAAAMRNVIKEEFAASRNALRLLHKYNKTLTDPNLRVNTMKARNALKHALGTYKKGAIPLTAISALAPLGLYGAHKLYKSRNKDN